MYSPKLTAFFVFVFVWILNFLALPKNLKQSNRSTRTCLRLDVITLASKQVLCDTRGIIKLRIAGVIRLLYLLL